MKKQPEFPDSKNILQNCSTNQHLTTQNIPTIRIELRTTLKKEKTSYFLNLLTIL